MSTLAYRVWICIRDGEADRYDTLATRLGATREKVSEALRGLVNKGVIQRRNPGQGRIASYRAVVGEEVLPEGRGSAAASKAAGRKGKRGQWVKQPKPAVPKPRKAKMTALEQAWLSPVQAQVAK